MPRRVVTRAPTRLDFGGGWTDVPPYSSEMGGYVCNVAIARYATVELTPIERNAARAAPFPSDPMTAAALRRRGVRDAAVELRSDFPMGAGLGGSSAASAALLGALTRWRDKEWDPVAIAEEGRRIEVEELGVAGGRQDHYAATHGGALGLRFTNSVDVRRIPLSARLRAALERRLLLIYTGKSRISGDTITAVLHAYRARDRAVLHALERMKAVAEQMTEALVREDVDALGALVGEHWIHQRSLHPAIPTPRIDAIIEQALRAGAIGAKAMGASGGGCVLVVSDKENADRVADAIRRLGELVTFSLDEAGLHECK